ncbi:Hypothetical predicted protein [Cloeon dipterum]|uniref:CX domain-containing protein n=1 Tax=Cloeon dipterum TaxID=197152 RepID=A0A8S1DK09_9INSE|nr:Hypothetical predicted protein [Cloeon dipterum]
MSHAKFLVLLFFLVTLQLAAVHAKFPGKDPHHIKKHEEKFKLCNSHKTTLAQNVINMMTTSDVNHTLTCPIEKTMEVPMYITVEYDYSSSTNSTDKNANYCCYDFSSFYFYCCDEASANKNSIMAIAIMIGIGVLTFLIIFTAIICCFRYCRSND